MSSNITSPVKIQRKRKAIDFNHPDSEINNLSNTLKKTRINFDWNQAF